MQGKELNPALHAFITGCWLPVQGEQASKWTLNVLLPHLCRKQLHKILPSRLALNGALVMAAGMGLRL